MKNSEEFISIYNRLDKYLGNERYVNEEPSNTSLIDDMVRKENLFFRTHKDDLKWYTNLRNAIVHNSDPNAYPQK